MWESQLSSAHIASCTVNTAFWILCLCKKARVFFQISRRYLRLEKLCLLLSCLVIFNCCILHFDSSGYFIYSQSVERWFELHSDKHTPHRVKSSSPGNKTVLQACTTQGQKYSSASVMSSLHPAILKSGQYWLQYSSPVPCSSRHTVRHFEVCSGWDYPVLLLCFLHPLTGLFYFQWIPVNPDISMLVLDMAGVCFFQQNQLSKPGVTKIPICLNGCI